MERLRGRQEEEELLKLRWKGGWKGRRTLAMDVDG